MADSSNESNESEMFTASQLSVLGSFFMQNVRNKEEWTMKCKLCSTKIRSKPGVSSNFHRHLRVCRCSLMLFGFLCIQNFSSFP